MILRTEVLVSTLSHLLTTPDLSAHTTSENHSCEHVVSYWYSSHTFNGSKANKFIDRESEYTAKNLSPIFPGPLPLYYDVISIFVNVWWYDYARPVSTKEISGGSYLCNSTTTQPRAKSPSPWNLSPPRAQTRS